MTEQEFIQSRYHLGTLFNSGKITAKEYNKRIAELMSQLKVL